MSALAPIFTLVFTLLASAALTQPALVLQGQRVAVSGETSVGGFRCEFKRETTNDPVSIQGGLDTGAALLDMKIPVKDFGCGNFLLNRDFQKTLQQAQFPYISVKVLSLRRLGNETYQGHIELTIVGRTLSLSQVDFRRVVENRGPVLKAELTLDMTELGLEPPKRFGGLIRVDHKLGVIVDLVL